MIHNIYLLLVTIATTLSLYTLLKLRNSIVSLLSLWVIFCVKIVVSSYILSMINQLNIHGFVILETLLMIILLTLNKYKVIKIRFDIFGTCARQNLMRYYFMISRNWGLSIFLITIFIIYLYNLVISILLPLSNHDALSYHVPRFLHWLANGNLDHYVTTDFRQNELPQINAIMMMWVYLVSGFDTAIKSVQWISAFIVGLSIYSLCRIGFGSIKISIWTALVFLCFPMVVLQSGTAQSDLIVTAFTTISVLYLYMFFKFTKGKYLWISAMAFALGIGTKLTVAFLVPGMLVVIIILSYRNSDKGLKLTLANILRVGVAYVCSFIVIGAYNFIQNFLQYGSFISNPDNVANHTTRASDFAPFGTLMKYVYQMVDFTGTPTGIASSLISVQELVFRNVFAKLNIDPAKGSEYYTHQFDFQIFWGSPPHSDWASFGFIGFLIFIGGFAFYKLNQYQSYNKWIGYGWFLIFLMLIPWTFHKTRYFILPMALLVTQMASLFKGKRRALNKVFLTCITIISIFTLSFVSLNAYGKSYSELRGYLTGNPPNAYLSTEGSVFDVLSYVIKPNSVIGIHIPGFSKEYLIWDKLHPSEVVYIDPELSSNEVYKTNNQIKYLLTSNSNVADDQGWTQVFDTGWYISFKDSSSREFLKSVDQNKILKLLKIEKEESKYYIDKSSILLSGFFQDGWSERDFSVSIPTKALGMEGPIKVDVQVTDMLSKTPSLAVGNQGILEPCLINGECSFIWNSEMNDTITFETATAKPPTNLDQRELGIRVGLISFEEILFNNRINLLELRMLWSGMYGDRWVGRSSNISIPRAMTSHLENPVLQLKINEMNLNESNFKVSYGSNEYIFSDLVDNILYIELDSATDNFITIESETFVPSKTIEGSVDHRELGLKIEEAVIYQE